MFAYYTIIGMCIRRNVEEQILEINQSAYLKKVLLKFGMDQCKPIITPIEIRLNLDKTDEKLTSHPYRELVGNIMYAETSFKTRPLLCCKLF